MKVIVAGSRTITDYSVVKQAIEDSGFKITELVSGHAKGVDRLGEQWAKEHDINTRCFLPDWTYRNGGMRRNCKMVDYVGKEGGLVACWDGHSRGTQQCIEYATAKGLHVYVKVLK